MWKLGISENDLAPKFCSTNWDSILIAVLFSDDSECKLHQVPITAGWTQMTQISKLFCITYH